ncbi:unnamed protein product [Cyclocybe aegerita]|uniref:Uncharacterized protein n=1 Tax=Cyclocybe aegerita TaxID=1973307 RepID=A0A8S0W6Q5_CYCAE|nr:unnamed protein product [Cyclocybe aegerita]
MSLTYPNYASTRPGLTYCQTILLSTGGRAPIPPPQPAVSATVPAGVRQPSLAKTKGQQPRCDNASTTGYLQLLATHLKEIGFSAHRPSVSQQVRSACVEHAATSLNVRSSNSRSFAAATPIIADESASAPPTSVGKHTLNPAPHSRPDFGAVPRALGTAPPANPLPAMKAYPDGMSGYLDYGIPVTRKKQEEMKSMAVGIPDYHGSCTVPAGEVSENASLSQEPMVALRELEDVMAELDGEAMKDVAFEMYRMLAEGQGAMSSVQ